jgi:hypothetical protein
MDLFGSYMAVALPACCFAPPQGPSTRPCPIDYGVGALAGLLSETGWPTSAASVP